MGNNRKVRSVDERKTLYLSDLRKLGRIAVRFKAYFESQENEGQWIADLEWNGERRYFVVEEGLDRVSFEQLEEGSDVEIESVGRPGIPKVAIYRNGKRIDAHARQQEARERRDSERSGGVPVGRRTSLDAVLTVYATAFKKAVPMVQELDPTGEHGLTVAQVAAAALEAYCVANMFAPPPTPRVRRESSPEGSDTTR